MSRPGLTRAGRAHARSAVRLTVPQHGCAARCARLGLILRAVGRLHRVARVLADERTRPCTARAGLAHTRSALALMQPVHARRIGGGLERNQCTFGYRGRRTGFADDGREWHHALGLLGAECAEESLALRKHGFARILLRHLGVA